MLYLFVDGSSCDDVAESKNLKECVLQYHRGRSLLEWFEGGFAFIVSGEVDLERYFRQSWVRVALRSGYSVCKISF